jgi:hypothetical protein
VAAEADLVAAGLARVDPRAQHPLAQPQDLRFEHRLVVLGVVVLGVLLQVAPLARGPDALGDLRALDVLQALDLGAELVVVLLGHQEEVGHDDRV